MSQITVDEALKLLRSYDLQEYEDGYQWFKGNFLTENIDLILEALLTETEPELRSRLVELIGDPDLETHIRILEQELRHHDLRVREWAHASLKYSNHAGANKLASVHEQAHPNEPFL